MNETECELREYDTDRAMLIAKLMTDVQSKVSRKGSKFLRTFMQRVQEKVFWKGTMHATAHAQQYALKKGLQKFGDKGIDSVTKELDQLHQRTCFSPVDVSTMTQEEQLKAMVAIMLLTEKRDGTIKS